MLFSKLFSKCLILPKIPNIFHCIKACVTYDKHFEFFRNRTEYKNLIVQLNTNDHKIDNSHFTSELLGNNLETDKAISFLLQRDYVMKLSTEQLKDIMCWLAKLRINTTEYYSALKYLDEKCALSVERWNLDLSLYILDAWVIIFGPKAFKKHYYAVVTSMWTRKMKKCSKYNLILMFYFIGVSKSSPPFLMEILENKMENYVSELTDEEWAVACLSFFKTSKAMTSKSLLNHSCEVAQSLLIKNDRFNLINVLKCLRISRYYDKNLWCILCEYVLKEHKTFNFVECTNFLAAFAAQTFYEKELFDCLESQSMNLLCLEHKSSILDQDFSKMHPSLRSRVKDVARFMWAMASVGHLTKECTVTNLDIFLKQRFDAGEFDTKLHILIDCLQSFIILNYCAVDLMKTIFSPSLLNQILSNDRVKPRYQIYFIHKSLQIEYPKVDASAKTISTPIPKNLNREVTERNGFQALVKFLTENVAADIKYCYIVPHIMIAGIIANISINKNIFPNHTKEMNNIYFNNFKMLIDNGIISKYASRIFQEGKVFICIEVLDLTVCVGSTTEPIGLMKTKIRQLEKLNFQVITLTSEEISLLVSANDLKKCSKLSKIFF